MPETRGPMGLDRGLKAIGPEILKASKISESQYCKTFRVQT